VGFGRLQSRVAHSLTRQMRSSRAGLSIPANDVISITEVAFFPQTLLTGGSTPSLDYVRVVEGARLEKRSPDEVKRIQQMGRGLREPLLRQLLRRVEAGLSEASPR